MAERGRSGGWFGGSTRPGAPDAVEESMRVAERLSAPDTGGISRAGLPIRTPKAHLVPGAFGAGAGEKSSTRDTPPPPDRSAEEVRKHLDGYQSGTRRARGSAR
jgi:hypothetical protein